MIPYSKTIERVDRHLLSVGLQFLWNTVLAESTVMHLLPSFAILVLVVVGNKGVERMAGAA